MKQIRKIISLIINIFLGIVACVTIVYAWKMYKANDFGEFNKAEYKLGISIFKRDSDNRYSNKYSYMISSNEFNDALVYKTIEVEPNSVYKVSAMVKYEDVENEKEETEAGVNIGIMDTTEKSQSLVGSGDWQELSFIFDSKNRESIDIAFRLGSYEDNTKGTVWFSDLKIEKGEKKTDNNWKFACFVFKNIDMNYNENGIEKRVELSLNQKETGYIEENIKRFQSSINDLSRRIDKCRISNNIH